MGVWGSVKQKSSYWKQKVDPAFDRIIRKYIELFSLVEFPSSSGWLKLDDAYFQKYANKILHGWILPYEKEMTKQRILSFTGLRKMDGAERIKVRADFRKLLFEEIKIIPQESQDYYKRIFEPYYSESEKLAFDFSKNMTAARWKEEVRAFISNWFFLRVHVALIEIENETKLTDEKTIQKKYLRPSLIMEFLLSLYNSIALLVFNISLTELLKDAKSGNEEAFFKILQIDRTAVECEWAKRMLRKAQLTADKEFFQKVAKAMTTSPMENRKIYGQVSVVLLLFWRFGLWRLENDELIELLKDSGIRVQKDPETFRKYVAREVKPFFDMQEVPSGKLQL